MRLTDFTCSAYPLFFFGNTTSASTKLIQNKLQTASRIHFCTVFKIFQSHLQIRSFIFIFTLGIYKNRVCNSVYSQLAESRHLSMPDTSLSGTPNLVPKVCASERVHGISGYKYWSVVASMRTIFQFSAILLRKMGTLFVIQANRSK